MKKIICYLLLFLSPVMAHSQLSTPEVKTITIKGIVLDDNKTPLASVSVWIAYKSSPASIVKSGITGQNGEFTLNAPADKEYVMTIKMLGYKTIINPLKAADQNIDLGNLNMVVAITKLDEVVVRQPLTVTADKIIYNFEHDPDRKKSSMLDMIQKLPMIGYDEFENRLYVGSPEKTYIVLRKGREDALLNSGGIPFDVLLQKLPAMGFTTFEIWTVVPPKYAAYDYVINILPDPMQRLFGVIGSTDAGHDFGKGVSSLSQGLKGSADKVRFNGNFSFANRNAPETTGEQSILFFPTETTGEIDIRQRSRQNSSGENYNAGLQMSVDLFKNQFINLGFKGNIDDSRNNNISSIDSLVNGVHTLAASGNRSSISLKKWELSAAYQFDFKKTQRNLNLSYLMTSSPLTRNDRFFTIYEDALEYSQNRLTQSDESNVSHRVQLDYADAFDKGKYRLSARVGYLSQDYDRTNPVRDLIADQQDIDAYTGTVRDLERLDGYLSLSWNAAKRLNLSATGRADYLINETLTSVTGSENVQNINQKNLLMGGRGGLSYRFDIKQSEKQKAKSMMAMPSGACNSSLSLYYDYQQSRPAIDQLTNYINMDDPLNVRRGNPNLNVEKSHEISLYLTPWFPVQPQVSYKFSNNMIVPQTVVETTEEGTLIVTGYDNAGRYRQFMVSGNYMRMPDRAALAKPFYFGFGMLTAVYMFSKTDYGDRTFNNTSMLMMMSSWRLRINKINITPMVSYYNMFYDGVGGASSINPWSISFSFSHNYEIGEKGDRLTWSIQTGNILHLKSRSKGSTDRPEFRRTWETSTQRIPLSFKISYSYGKFKVKPVRSARNAATVDGFSSGDPDSQEKSPKE